MRNMNLKESNLRGTWPYSCRFPYSSCFPVSLAVIHNLTHFSSSTGVTFSITAFWSSNTLRRNLKHQTPSINRETPNLLQWVNPPPHWNTALVPDKNGQGIGSPGQWPAEHPAGGDYINTSRRSLWGAGASHCLCGHCAHSRGRASTRWEREFRNATFS